MRTIALLICGLLAYLGSAVTKEVAWTARDTWPLAAQSVIAPELATAAGTILGREMAADLFWVRGLVYYGSARAETGDYDQMEEIIDAILKLDPNFKKIYEWAAYAVTFKKDVATEAEYRVSLRYLEKALVRYPNQYRYFWLAGLRYYIDLRSDDPEEERRYRERGADLIAQAMRKPDAPAQVATLAASLHTKLGQTERAIRDLEQMIMTTDNPQAREQMYNRLRGIGGHDVYAEIVTARREFDQKHIRDLPLTPLSFYVLMGEPPKPGFSMADLARDETVDLSKELVE